MSGLFSLREVIKNHEAIFVAAVKDVVYTHEMLISAIAGQMGAHEAEGLEHRLVQLNGFLINQQPLYVPTLALDAELTLELCERVLDHAEMAGIFRRAQRSNNRGDVTLVARFSLKNHLAGPAPVVTFRFPISETDIVVHAGPHSAAFVLRKRGKHVAEISIPYPDGWGFNEDAVFALSYSSNHRLARTIINDRVNGGPVGCDVGWLDAHEIRQPERHEVSKGFVAVNFLMCYGRMLKPSDCGEILQLSPDMRELMQKEPNEGPFPS
jgi:hypothetical protein